MRGKRAKNASLTRHEGNRLLNALPRPEYESLLPELEAIALNLRDALYGPESIIRHAHFPLSGVASLIAVDNAGLAVEVVSVGNEGMVGMALFHRCDSSPHSCLIQIPGEAKRIGAKTLARQLPDLPALQRLLHRYSNAQFNDAAQTVVCNRRHSAIERCARWLLLTDDRMGGAKFALTQEFLAYMLADRRSAVSVAASHLQNDGLIRYSRGSIEVTDRDGLESASCECYPIIRASQEHVFE